MEYVRVAVVVVVVLIAGVAVYQSLVDRETACVSFDGGDDSGGVTVTATVSDDSLSRLVGLSLHDDLSDGEGMLFVFGDESERTFVMRGMSFGIDIVFVDSDGTVTKVAEAKSPSEADGRQEFTATAQYVVEVPRGYADANGIEAGDDVVINRGCDGAQG